MNPQLQKLFDMHNFSQKDRYDFMQIYDLLPDYKKTRVIDGFDEIAKSIQGLQNTLRVEQEILFGRAIENIESQIQNRKGLALSTQVRDELQKLKMMI